MENKIFWALFAIALIAGFALGTSVNTSLTGRAAIWKTAEIEATRGWSNIGNIGDSGLDYNQKGYCKAGDFKMYPDTCEQRRYLTETYWTQDGCQTTEIDCIALGYYICYQGACMTEEEYMKNKAAEAEPTPQPQ